MKQQEEKTPEEVEKITEAVISNQTEAQKFKKNSEGKPGQKLEVEKQVESVINNL
jgi:hypothetical protein